VIEVEALWKVYRGREPIEALAGVSFTATPGTIFGLLGPNGAGKTTTLRIIATVLRASSGSVRVDGLSVDEDPQGVRRRIGFLSASTALYERLTPVELLQYFGRLNGMSEETLSRRIDELTETLDMAEFRDRPCGLLSTGQKQKASIARALIHDPPVLIFDEPTSGLDVLVARTLVKRIAALRDARRTIVLSTHIMHEAERLCDEVAIIHAGRIHTQGTVAAIKELTGEANLEDAFFQLIDAEADADADADAEAPSA